ncbi:MAG TPA: hypothetical protein VMX94_06345, partial [Armatimonadota bacterium]|nr:hypothetical protein [Armatimonadota bacterium]
RSHYGPGDRASRPCCFPKSAGRKHYSGDDVSLLKRHRGRCAGRIRIAHPLGEVLTVRKW